MFVKKRNQKYYYFLALKALLDPTLSHSLSPTCEKSGLHHEASACARCGLSVCPSASDHHCSTAVEEGRRKLDSPRVWLRLPGTGEEARGGTTAPSAGQEPQEQSSQTPPEQADSPGQGIWPGPGHETPPGMGLEVQSPAAAGTSSPDSPVKHQTEGPGRLQWAQLPFLRASSGPPRRGPRFLP